MAFNLTPRTSNSDAVLCLHTDKLRMFLDSIGTFVQRKSTSNILKSVRIHCENGVGYMQATNHDCYVDMLINSSSSKGSIDLAVDYQELVSILFKSPRGMLSIERKGMDITFKMGFSTYGTLAGVAGTDFPSLKMPTDEKPDSIRIPAFDSRYIYNYIVPNTIANDEYSGISCVLVESSKDSCSFTSTDRKMLVSTNPYVSMDNKHIIPCSTFKLVASFDTDFQMDLYKARYSFTSNDIRIYGSYPSGLFPDIHRVVPKTFDHVHKVDVACLREEINRLLTVVKPVKEGIYPVMLTYESEILHAVEVPKDYVLDKSGIKMDAKRIEKLLARFDDNSDVVFKSTSALERPTVWEDSRATTLLCCLR